MQGNLAGPGADVLVSIVVPTYNEEADIRDTLEALAQLSYPNKEVLIVDDSTDNTPAIIQEYANKGIKLLKRRVNKDGRSGARNAGIRAAKGEIVIILNADVFLPVDFIERILVHYKAGYDYVLVESSIENPQHLFARYVEALHIRDHKNQDWIEWTEGFSCRRDVAFKAGLFPEGLPIPLVAGEDGVFGRTLAKRFRKKIDRNLVVHHRAPWTFSNYWSSRKEKEKPYVHFFVDKKPLINIFFHQLAKTVLTMLWLFLLVPWILTSWKLSGFSPRGRKDFIPFLGASFIAKLAGRVSAWEGFFKILRLRAWTS